MRIGAAQQRFAARMFELRGLAVRFFQFVDRFQGIRASGKRPPDR